MNHGLKEIISKDAFEHSGAVSRKLSLGRLPRYPSGIEGVDEKAGGFYGLTVLSAGPKAGKSLVGLRSALDTACRIPASKVIHIDFELDELTFTERLLRAYGAYSLEDLNTSAPWLAQRCVFIEGRSAEISEISMVVADSVCEEIDEFVLIVIDSVARMAKRMDDAGRKTFFKAQQAITDWARNCVTLSKGEIGAILFSEVNRGGQTKGQDMDYAADCVVNIHKNDEDNPSEVELFFISRATPGGKLGNYRIDQDQLKMVYLGDPVE